MRTIDTIQSPIRSHAGFGNRVTIVLIGFFKTIGRIMERRKSRLDLLELSDAQLKDIGISRADAYREAHRSLLDPVQLWSQSERSRGL